MRFRQKKLLLSAATISLLSTSVEFSQPIWADATTNTQTVTLQPSPYSIGQNWTINNNFGAWDFPDAFAYGNSMFLMVGFDGCVYGSKDGASWDKYSAFPTYSFDALDSNGHDFVVFGSTGTTDQDAMYSNSTAFLTPDGKTWTQVSYDFGEHISNVAYGDGKFVALGTSHIFVSSDGLSWTKEALKISNSGYFSSVVFANDTFFVSGVNSGANSGLLVSKDGVNWTSKSAPVITSVTWTGKKYFATDGGKLYQSGDGLNWTPVSGIPAGNGVSVGYNRHTIVYYETLKDKSGPNSSVVVTSNDGKHWAVHRDGLSVQMQTVISYKGVFVGASAFPDPHSAYTFFSKNGIDWSIHPLGATTHFLSVATNGKRTVAVGDNGTTAYTDNGVQWRPGVQITTGEGSGSNLHPLPPPTLSAVAWDGKKFVAVGWHGAYYSYKGVNWTNVPISSTTDFQLSRMVWTGKFFVANDEVYNTYMSRDGIHWTKVTNLNFDQWLVGFGSYKGNALAVDVNISNKNYDTSSIIESSDGLHWKTVAHLGKFEAPYVNIVNNGKELLYTDGYSAWISQNGTSWKKYKTNIDIAGGAGMLTAMDAYDGHFFIMGQTDGGNANVDNVYLTSRDGMHWQRYSMPSFVAPNDNRVVSGVQAYGKNIFVGGNGVILTLN